MEVISSQFYPAPFYEYLHKLSSLNIISEFITLIPMIKGQKQELKHLNIDVKSFGNSYKEVEKRISAFFTKGKLKGKKLIEYLDINIIKAGEKVDKHRDTTLILLQDLKFLQVESKRTLLAFEADEKSLLKIWPSLLETPICVGLKVKSKKLKFLLAYHDDVKAEAFNIIGLHFGGNKSLLTLMQCRLLGIKFPATLVEVNVV